MKYFILAGEKSGDLHAGNLAGAIKRQLPSAVLYGWGGSEMEKTGVNLLRHYHDLAFMGLDFLSNLGKIRDAIRLCKKQIESFGPTALILVDYSGFNLRIARWAHKKGIRVYYYIAPKTWAWNSMRNRTIRKFVDHLLVIFPFEEAYFRSKNIKTTYCGNPLVERIQEFKPKKNYRNELPDGYDKVVALLPGSRKSELERISEEMKKIAQKFDDTLFVVAGVSELDKKLYDVFECIKNCHLVFDQTYDLLSVADAAVVTSGTATLETALFNVPQLVVYRTSGLTYFVAKNMLKIKFISLVNILMDREVVKELIQDNFNSDLIRKKLKMLLEDHQTRQSLSEDYRLLQKQLGDERASENAAAIIISNN
jgi:lipid-A-disaccharide synthase